MFENAWHVRYSLEVARDEFDSYADRLLRAADDEIQSLNDRIARLEAGQRELEARLGDGE